MHRDLEMEEKSKRMSENKQQKRWLVALGFVAVAVFGGVCFGAGFAVAYVVAPCAGR